MSAEAYRGIIFILTWSLVLEVVAILLLATTQGTGEMVAGVSILALITGILLAFFVYKARRAVLEEIE
ncbi:MAG: hypothetical protein QXT57_01230 [Thermosphaera sp.]